MTHSQEKWQQAYGQFYSNIIRVYRLIDASLSHTTVDEKGQKNLDQAGDDIARSAIVFLHATFEAFLRDLAHKRKGTYSTVQEVVTALKGLSINYSDQSKYLPGIGEMMKRRHKIVHHADLGAGSSEPNRLSYEESVSFTSWFHDVDIFASEIVQPHVSPEYASSVESELRKRKAARERFEKQRRSED
ncbi:MAG: hypothetical protein O6941_01845 [Planctomycetota bacterium]|nr:hypothetical protein [Planctomycetota bacterium]